MAREPNSVTRRSERRPGKRANVLLFDEPEREEPHPEAAVAIDESDFGARIQTEALLKTGQIIDLQSEDLAWRFRCRVVWTGEVSSDREGQAGLEFLLPRNI